MDPNATLDSIRRFVGEVEDRSEDPMALFLAEHVQALDEWLTRGGFLPTAWESA